MDLRINDDDLGQFLGGLLTVLVRNRAHELAGDLDDREWKLQRAQLLSEAFDDIVGCFPEPLQTKLRASRDEFLATMNNLN